MIFTSMLANSSVILTEGAVIERLWRETTLALDPNVANAGFIYDPAKKVALVKIYRQYLVAIQPSGLPLLLFTPTWRANPERLKRAGLGNLDVNGDCYRFLARLRADYGEYAQQIWIGGLLGCQGDAYNPQEGLTTPQARSFHRWQAAALATAGVDFLFAATLPAAEEALGLAQAMAETGKSYFLSFVVRPTGTLLDGTPLSETVATIDAGTAPPPLGYLINCVHPIVFEQALQARQNATGSARRRIIGFQANTSAKSPEELNGSVELKSETPAVFARQLIKLQNRWNLKILGGCCGTDQRHLRALMARLKKQPMI